MTYRKSPREVITQAVQITSIAPPEKFAAAVLSALEAAGYFIGDTSVADEMVDERYEAQRTGDDY